MTLRKIYIWVPEDKYRGHLIGPGGQNISTLEYITRTDVQVREDRWVIVHETQICDLDMAVNVIWNLFQGNIISPLKIIRLADEFKKDRDGVGLFDYLKLEEEDVLPDV